MRKDLRSGERQNDLQSRNCMPVIPFSVSHRPPEVIEAMVLAPEETECVEGNAYFPPEKERHPKRAVNEFPLFCDGGRLAASHFPQRLLHRTSIPSSTAQ